MKIVVIGGTGLIGSQVIAQLIELGHEAVAASPRSGVNAVTGEGLAEALAGADTVVDVANSPSWADDDVLQFFTTSTRNLLAAERDAGVQHHVALSIVGATALPDSGYMRAKVAQEKVIEESGAPYTIVRATQFFEFVGGIADSMTDGDTVRAPHGAFQPIAAADVATAVTRATTGDPVNGIIQHRRPRKARHGRLHPDPVRRRRRCAPSSERRSSPLLRCGARRSQHRSRRRREHDHLPHQLQRLAVLPRGRRLSFNTTASVGDTVVHTSSMRP